MEYVILGNDVSCGLVQENDDDFDWTQQSGKTSSGGWNNRKIDGIKYPVTGPENAYSGDKYIYTEVSGRPANQKARFEKSSTNY